MKNKLAKVLRIVTIVLLSITAAWTVLSGVGTTCVAFGAEKYESMAAIVPYKGLYQAFVFLTLAVGAAAIAATIAFARGKRWAFGGLLGILAAGIVVGGVHMYYSNMLRGSSAPANLRVYLSVLSIAALLVLRIPGIWKALDFGAGKPGSVSNLPGAAAMIAGGITALSAPWWATPTHVLDGTNWAHFIDGPLMGVGAALILIGLGMLAWPVLAARVRTPQALERKRSA